MRWRVDELTLTCRLVCFDCLLPCAAAIAIADVCKESGKKCLMRVKYALRRRRRAQSYYMYIHVPRYMTCSMLMRDATLAAQPEPPSTLLPLLLVANLPICVWAILPLGSPCLSFFPSAFPVVSSGRFCQAHDMLAQLFIKMIPTLVLFHVLLLAPSHHRHRRLL